ncbi:Ras family protein [compost metagenome]
MFDICDKASFLSLDAWIEDIRQFAPPDVVILICGNKKDKEESRVVFYEEGSKYAQEMGALYTETSAKDHESVLEAFTLLTNEVLPKAEEGMF